ncbi:hypothetical protein [Amycolatopsis lurida]
MTGKRPAPDRDAIWRIIAAQRTSLADLLDDQWWHPSLCAGHLSGSAPA